MAIQIDDTCRADALRIINHLRTAPTGDHRLATICATLGIVLRVQLTSELRKNMIVLMRPGSNARKQHDLRISLRGIEIAGRDALERERAARLVRMGVRCVNY